MDCYHLFIRISETFLRNTLSVQNSLIPLRYYISVCLFKYLWWSSSKHSRDGRIPRVTCHTDKSRRAYPRTFLPNKFLQVATTSSANIRAAGWHDANPNMFPTVVTDEKGFMQWCGVYRAFWGFECSWIERNDWQDKNSWLICMTWHGNWETSISKYFKRKYGSGKIVSSKRIIHLNIGI